MYDNSSMRRVQLSRQQSSSTIDYLLSAFGHPGKISTKRVRFDEDSVSVPAKRQKVDEPPQRLAVTAAVLASVAPLTGSIPSRSVPMPQPQPQPAPTLLPSAKKETEEVEQSVAVTVVRTIPITPITTENRIYVIAEKTLKNEKILCDPLPAKLVRPMTIKFMSNALSVTLSIEIFCTSASTLFIKKGGLLSLSCELSLYAKGFSQIEFVPDFSQATPKSTHDKSRRSTSPVTIVVKCNGIQLYQWSTKVHSKSSKEETAPKFLWFSHDQHSLKASGDQSLFVGAHLACLCSTVNCDETVHSALGCTECKKIVEQEKLTDTLQWMRK